MASREKTKTNQTYVAIDIAKKYHTVLVQYPGGQRKAFKMANNRKDYDTLCHFLRCLPVPPVIAFEATGDYHRTLAYRLHCEGFRLRLVSSLAVARTREALFNAWDKNDPRDAQVILHLLKTGVTQFYRDPLVEKTNDLQEFSKTHFQISLRKTRLQHSIMNHYLPLYFPEVAKYYSQSRAAWFSRLLYHFPCPATITSYTLEKFQTVAGDIVGRKVNKQGFLIDLYRTAERSIGLPVNPQSQAISLFRMVLKEHHELCEKRARIESQVVDHLQDNPDFHRLQSLPGIGPILALTILAEAGDLRRFSHHKKFLKYCGLDLATQQSGQYRGQTKLSKRGNRRLRYAFWIAATVAIRMRENSFSQKYYRYVKQDPNNAHVKRKAYVAVAAKIARVAYGIIKNNTEYHPFYEKTIPSGKIPSPLPLRQS